MLATPRDMAKLHGLPTMGPGASVARKVAAWAHAETRSGLVRLYDDRAQRDLRWAFKAAARAFKRAGWTIGPLGMAAGPGDRRVLFEGMMAAAAAAWARRDQLNALADGLALRGASSSSK